jgi:hypothetical protein
MNTDPAKNQKSLSVAEWFSLPAIGTATREELDARLHEERDAWDSSLASQ